MKKSKPFIKWVGGKRQLLSQFKNLNILPPSGFNIDSSTYFEPFLGGGAVFFDILPQNAILSDLNSELIITYKIIKENVESLISNLKNHENNKDYFLKIRSLDVTKLSNLEIASRFIYLNKTCFNGMYRVNKSGKFNVPYGKYKNPIICDDLNLRNVSLSLFNKEILNEDFTIVLDKSKKGDFIYFDPPYYPLNTTSNFTSYTKEGFLEIEQLKLRDTFKELDKRGCFVMLSNSNTEYIRYIYNNIKNINIYEVNARRSINSDANKRGKISEIVITNY